MNVLPKSLLSVLTLTAFSTCGFAFATTVPFDVTSGSGTLDAFPADPFAPEIHDITAGTVLLDGEELSYSGFAGIQIVGPPTGDPSTALVLPFDSGIPFTFDFDNGNTFQMDYGVSPEVGVATLTPDNDNQGGSDVVFLATFNVIPGSGTGDFEKLIGGELFMIAEMDNIEFPTGINVPYSWSSGFNVDGSARPGFLTFVPEPSTAVIAALASLGLTIPRRR